MTAPSHDFHHPGASALRRFVLYWWVVPRVQWALFDLDYQLYVFALFHGDRRTRTIHYTTIFGISFFILAFLARWPLYAGAPAGVSVALAYAAAVALVHLPWCLACGVLPVWIGTAALLAGQWLGATAYDRWTRLPGAPWYAPTASIATNPLVWIYVLSLVETASHGLEPVPPYNSGKARWVSSEEFKREGGAWVVVAGLCTPTLFTLTSLLSNPRSLPTALVWRILALFGYRGAQRRAIAEMVAAEWRAGQPRLHSAPQRTTSVDYPAPAR
jgi:hypothetical protein